MKVLIDKIPFIIKGLLILFLFYNSVIFQYIPLLLFRTPVSSISGNYRAAVLLSAFSDLVVIIILLFVYRKDLFKEFQIFIKKFKKNIDTGFACWGVGMIIMVVSNTILISLFHSQANNETVVREMIHVFPIIMGLNVCLFAPFIEEIVFRKTLKDIFKNPYLFITISFLTFGIAHVNSMATSFVDWLYVIPYGALGGAFALAYYKTDTVFTSMCFHMLHNIFVFLIVLCL